MLENFLETNLRAFLVLAGLGGALSASAAVETLNCGNFNISFYGAGDQLSSAYYGTYTGAQDWSEEMRNCVERSINYWNSLITTEATERVEIVFIWEDLGPRALGGAADAWYFDPYSGLTLSGTEATLRNASGSANLYNFSNNETRALVVLSKDADYYYGESTSGIRNNQYDLQSVLTHEIGHVMGFNTLCTETGWGVVNTQSASFALITTFDSMMAGKNGSGEVINLFEAEKVAAVEGWTAYSATSAYAPGEEYFLNVGETAEGAAELSRLKVYNPDLYESGSSMAHVETPEGGDGNALMYYAIGGGSIRRELNADELILLEAMGWTLAAVPEPSIFGLFAGALALSMAASRRRRKTKA